MQRQVLVLLVTFDLWVSLLVSVFPCLFLDLVVFCFRWLAGLRLGARRYLLLRRLGGRGPCPPARPLLPQCLAQASGSDSGLAAPTPPDPWLRTRVSGLGRSVAGWVPPWPSRGSRCVHACASGPGWGLCRDRGVTVGARGTTAKPPPVVFLLNVSGQHSRALAAAQLCPFRLPLSLSMGSPGPLILHRLCAAERCSPGRVRWLRGPPGAPLRLPKGLGVSMVPDKGYSL